MKRFLLSILCFAVCSTSLHAQEATLPSPDAKSMGMGGLTMTVLNASHAIYLNPAMGAFSRTPVQLSSSYYKQGDYNSYAVSGAVRFGQNNFSHIGWRQYLREKGNNDKALDLGYSRRIGRSWAVGAVTRYTRLTRPDQTTNALALDFSVAWVHPLETLGSFSTLRAGAKLTNIGGYFKHTDYELPINCTAGVALDTFLSDAHEITVGTDFGYYCNPSPVRGFQWSIGAEYNLMQFVQFRAGYHYGERRAYYPCYTSVGAGVRFLHLRLDFAYLFAAKQTAFRNTYSFSFGLDF
ncbi:MAG: PorV/PorQ family protein [Alistipes sp.]|nr:PorV/PorQ family protein [Alistipes sp.]